MAVKLDMMKAYDSLVAFPTAGSLDFGFSELGLAGDVMCHDASPPSGEFMKATHCLPTFSFLS